MGESNMDIRLKKKHWAIRYKYYIIAGVLFAGLLIYLLILSAGPRRLRYEADRLEIAEVTQDKFLEYLDVEGIVQPKLTLKVNAQESGTISEIHVENGSFLKAGDIIVTLTNQDLERTIGDERDELLKAKADFRQKEIQMEQKSSDLKRQSLETTYSFNRLEKEQALNEEEFKIGMISKAQYELAEEEFLFNKEKNRIAQESLVRDSILNQIQKDLLRTDLDRAEKRFGRSWERLENLIIRAPMDGQLSLVNMFPGERLTAGSSIGEMKVINEVKLNTKVSEYYIDRITLGLPATITYQDEKYPLKIIRVNPEIKERQFEVDLVFTEKTIDNARIGKSYRIQIELEQPEEALVMPKGNFFQQTGGQWIFKLNDSGNKAVRVPLSIGRQNPRQYEILDGLKPGDKVIITGYDNFGEAQEIILK